MLLQQNNVFKTHNERRVNEYFFKMPLWAGHTR